MISICQGGNRTSDLHVQQGTSSNSAAGALFVGFFFLSIHHQKEILYNIHYKGLEGERIYYTVDKYHSKRHIIA